MIWLLLAGPLPLIVAIVAIAGGLCGHELLGMWPEIRSTDRTLGSLAITAITAAPALHPQGGHLVGAVAAAGMLMWCLTRPEDLVIAAKRAMALLLGLAYVGGLAACLTAIAVTPDPGTPCCATPPFGSFDFGPAALLMLLVIVFAGDTGAYFAGRALGRHKLYPLVSPKKTIEGSVGGLIASIGGGALGAWLLVPQIPQTDALILGAACGLTAQIGDLAESMFKRASGTKDSGALLPGHGGMLDRLDGVLFAAPVFLAWLVAQS